MIVLLVNVVLVGKSTNLLKTTRLKVDSNAGSNVKADLINMIVVKDDLNSTGRNALSNEEDSVSTPTFEAPRIHPPAHNIRSEYEDVDPAEITRQRIPPPVIWPPLPGSQDECLYLHDYGLLKRLSTLSSSHCVGNPNSSPYTLYHVPGIDLKATKIDNFVLDMRSAQVARSISSLAQDGGGHDPRFKYPPNSSFCTCDDSHTAAHEAPNIWEDLVAKKLNTTDTACRPPTVETRRDVINLERAVVVARRDDHNPFFQISGILNAWIMMKVLGWESSSTQLVTLDRALPSLVDELRQVMLGPEHPVVGGDKLQQHAVHFESALLAPYEARGPMMSHLNDDQPCYNNEMIRDFRDEALRSMNVVPQKTDPKRCLVTVISRRPYGGRRIQRMWRNEDEILNLMRSDYKDAYRFGECEFQSLDFRQHDHARPNAGDGGQRRRDRHARRRDGQRHVDST